MTNPEARGETSIGGSARDFPATRWSRLLGSFEAGRLKDREAGEDLARRYWKPIYAYLRAKWGKPNEEAKDLTQDFFVWMFESDFLERPDPAKGFFRGFVKSALTYYMLNEEQKRRREKRGGGRSFLPLDGDAAGLASPATPPDALLDEAWRNDLFSRASVLLEEALRAEGKEAHFRLFRDHHLAATAGRSYRELGELHRMSENDVTNALVRTKERFRAILTDLVAETVRGPDELREELRALFGRDPR